MASPATSIPDTALGLTSAEVILLRQHQAVALQNAGPSSSRAASAASSQGRLLLDPGSLQALGYHFDRLMGAIQGRLQQVDSSGLHRLCWVANIHVAKSADPAFGTEAGPYCLDDYGGCRHGDSQIQSHFTTD